MPLLSDYNHFSILPTYEVNKIAETPEGLMIMVKNKYPLPLISELVNKLQGAKYFTKLDVCQGFNNVRM